MKRLLFSISVLFLSVFIIGETNKTITLAVPVKEYDFSATSAIFNNSPVPLPAQVAFETPINRVLGEASEEKRIYVDLTNQRVYAYQGDTLVHNFLVSTGKWGRTPTGTFRIWGKSRYQKMSGGSTALRTYYYLPNVPYIMWFSNDQVSAARGFSLHGTYWHDNFGHPMSHGCVNMKTEEAAIIYDWSDPPTGESKTIRASKETPGTMIIIYGKTPQS